MWKHPEHLLFLFLFAVSSGYDVYGSNGNGFDSIIQKTGLQDTIRDRQLLYNGILWTNMYHRIEGDQFLFSSFFLPGSVTINGRTFKNVKIKYDIFSDEVIIPINRDDIVQMNKEMVDSFTIFFENKVYRFTRIREDTLKGFTGYVNELYKGRSALYVKYIKKISPNSTRTSDGIFNPGQLIYLVKDNIVHQVTGTEALFRILNADKEQIRNFIKKNKLRISRKDPESFVPVIIYYDSISK
jgi:hypothetical protein